MLTNLENYNCFREFRKGSWSWKYVHKFTKNVQKLCKKVPSLKKMKKRENQKEKENIGKLVYKAVRKNRTKTHTETDPGNDRNLQNQWEKNPTWVGPCRNYAIYEAVSAMYQIATIWHIRFFHRATVHSKEIREWRRGRREIHFSVKKKREIRFLGSLNLMVPSHGL